MGEKVSKDPYLEKRMGNLRSYGPVSVHIADVVVYGGEERCKVTSAVIGLKITKRCCRGASKSSALVFVS